MSPGIPRTTRSDEGFTLIEVVISSAILFIAIMGVIGAMTFSAQASQSSSIRNRALSVANQYLEAARNLPYDAVGEKYANGTMGDPTGTILTPETTTSVGSTFTVYTEVDWARDPAPPYRAEYKKMRVTVAWTLPSEGQVTLETAIFGNSGALGNGDLEMYVKDRDTNQPVSGAQVTVDPFGAGSLRTRWSDSQGLAFFGLVEPGTATATVVVPGYIARPTTVSVAAKTITQQVAFVQKPSKIVVTVLDTSSSPVANAEVIAVSPMDGTRAPAYTDSTGKVTLSNCFVGLYTLSMTADGYLTPPSQVATVSTGAQTVAVNFSARASGGLFVTVRDSVTGSLINGATVTVTGPSPSTANAPGSPTTTGSDGEADFSSLVAGTYTYSVVRAGTPGVGPAYVADSGTAVVDWSADTPVTVELVPWGSMYIRLRRTSTGAWRTATNVTVACTAVGYSATWRSDSNGYIKAPYLRAGTYTIKSGTTTVGTYVVSDGVIPSTATVVSW